jgi:hypothetical protein
VFLVNSRFPLVCATTTSSGSKSLHQPWPSLSRSYRGNLPSSLTTVHPLALVFSTCPPVSVMGYGHRESSLEAFLGSMGSVTSPKRLGITSQAQRGPDLPRPRPTRLPQDNQRLGSPTLLRHPIASLLIVGRFASRKRQPLSNNESARARSRWYRNINRLCIDYALRPRLSSRLTLGGRTFPRNPWTSGGGDSHSSFATHANIRTRPQSTAGSPFRFTPRSTLRYHATKRLHPRLRLWT